MPMLPVVAILVFISVALLTAAILYPYLSRRSLLEERLARLAPQKFQQQTPTLIVRQSRFQVLVARIGAMFPPPARESRKYTQTVVTAGFRKEMLFVFWGVKLLLAIGLPLLFVAVVSFPRGKMLDSQHLLYAAGLAITGFLLPSVWLTRRAEKRKTVIFHTLPDILDLLTVCVEAGLGIDMAMIRASESTQFRGNPLAEEMKVAAVETRAGKPRSDALRDFAGRTGVEDVQSFVTMLIQTERFGTSLTRALRVHSDSLRTRRRQIAEEAAAKTAVKILFPLVFFIFPALLIVMLGPAVIMIGRVMK